MLADLRRRLELARYPVDAGNRDRYYGVDKEYLVELVDHWIERFDWRTAEARINAEFEQYDVTVDGVPIHFMRKPSAAPDAPKLILSHGWPWTDLMYGKVAGPLADPGATAAIRPRRSTSSSDAARLGLLHPRCRTTLT